MFPWQPLEKSEPGDQFCVFDLPGKGWLGLCICYDQWFPEMARTLALKGAEAVIRPTATYTPDRVPEMVLARVNAIANQIFWFNRNGVGDGGMGRSIFVDPEGAATQEAGQSECVMTQLIDLDLVTRVREYGALGQRQVWKSLREFRGSFSVYRSDLSPGEGFKDLGLLARHRKLAD